MTQEDLSPLLGYERASALSAVELGRTNLKPLDIVKLSHILDRPIFWFYGESAKPQTYDDWLTIGEGDDEWAHRHHQLELSFQEHEDFDAQGRNSDG